MDDFWVGCSKFTSPVQFFCSSLSTLLRASFAIVPCYFLANEPHEFLLVSVLSFGIGFSFVFESFWFLFLVTQYYAIFVYFVFYSCYCCCFLIFPLPISPTCSSCFRLSNFISLFTPVRRACRPKCQVSAAIKIVFFSSFVQLSDFTEKFTLIFLFLFALELFNLAQR